MIAVEEIQAAIDKLTKLRDESTSGPWFPWRSLSGRCNSSVDAATHDPDNPTTVCEGWRVQDVELIVTLHATIDAQLAILQEAHFQLSGAPQAVGFIGNEFNLFMRLVHAINGPA